MNFSDLILKNFVYRGEAIEGGNIIFSLENGLLSVEYSGKKIYIEPQKDVYLIHNNFNLDWKIISTDPAMDICHIIADYFFNSSVLAIIFHQVEGYENLSTFIRNHNDLYDLMVANTENVY